MRSDEAGFTMLEMSIVGVFMVPIMISVIGVASYVSEAIQEERRAMSKDEAVRITSQRLSKYLRAGVLSTCRTKAETTDVTAATAERLLDATVAVPTKGDWISPKDAEERETISFQSADGVLAMDTSAMTVKRELYFELEPGETKNGLDDDKDGMIDEGMLKLRLGSSQVVLVRGVERCRFKLDGRVMKVALSIASRNSAGEVTRRIMRRSFYLRNN